MGVSRPCCSRCQKVQPLQASAPWTSAPTRWIEPSNAARRQRAVGPHQRREALRGRRSASCPARSRPARPASRTARAVSARFGTAVSQRLGAQRLDRRDPLQRRRDIDVVALDADEVPAELPRHRARRAGAEERVEHHVARLGRRIEDAVEQRFRLLRRMQLLVDRRPSAARRRCRSGTASRSASACRRWRASSLRS